jgi:hypothetical protein
VPALAAFDYAVVRVVPRVEREEFINVGVIVHAPTLGFLGCRIEVDPARLSALLRGGAPDVEAVTAVLEGFRRVCAGARDAGPIAALPRVERFHWLVAPRSAVIQTSPVHGGLCADPTAALDDLFARRVA